MKKRFFCGVILAILMTALLSFSVSAAKIIEKGTAEHPNYKITWTLYDNGTLEFSGKGNWYAFSREHCTDDDLKYINMLKNYGKTIKKVVVNEGITGMGWDYYGCENLTEIVMPSSLESIYLRMLPTGKLDSITIPKTVKSVGAISGSSSIKNIYVDPDNPYYKSIDGVLFSKDGTEIVCYPTGRNETQYIIPFGVKTIGENAFNGATNLKDIIIPDSVIKIEYGAFVNTSLETLVIPEGITEFSEGCISGCKKLISLYLPSTVKEIQVYTYFDGASFVGGHSRKSVLEIINISKDNPYFKSVDGVVLSADGKKLVWFPKGKDDAVYLVPSSVTTIGSSAFANTSVKSVIVPRNVTKIGGDAFQNSTDLNSIYIPETVVVNNQSTIFGNYAQFDLRCKNLIVYGFAGSYIEKNLANNREYNGKLDDFKIPFVTITENEYQAKLNGHVFGSFSNGVAYRLGYDNILRISGTGAIPDFEAGKAPWFAYADKITAIEISDGITSIGACAFYGCKNVYGISLPGTITSIGYAAFNGCRGLSGFIVPPSVTTIGDYAFFDCKGLKYVTLYPGIVYIGSHAFEGCDALERINFPDTITYIGDYAFSSCTSLRETVIPTGVTELRPYVFNMCTGLVKVVIHSKVEVIDYTSFCGCSCHIHGYSGSYSSRYAESLGFEFVPLKFIWTDNSDWGTPELKKADEIKIFPESLKEKDLSQSITREEFAAISVKVYESLTGVKALPSVENPFNDTADVEVLKAYNLGITTGVSDTQFAPNTLLTREQAATMLTRVFKKATIPAWTVATDSEHPLTYTVPDAYWDHANISPWAVESVYFMTANGIINGVGNNLFAPKNTTTEEEATSYANATREQALIIAVRMIDKLSAK